MDWETESSESDTDWSAPIQRKINTKKSEKRQEELVSPKTLTYAYIILPYFGHLDEWASLMLRLCKQTKQIWEESTQVFLETFPKREFQRRTIKFMKELTAEDIHTLAWHSIHHFYALDVEISSSFMMYLFYSYISEAKYIKRNFLSKLTLHLSEETIEAYNKIIYLLIEKDIDLSVVRVKCVGNLGTIYDSVTYLPRIDSKTQCLQSQPFMIGHLNIDSKLAAKHTNLMEYTAAAKSITVDSLDSPNLTWAIVCNGERLENVASLTVTSYTKFPEYLYLHQDLSTIIGWLPNLKCYFSKFLRVSFDYLKWVITYFADTPVTIGFSASEEIEHKDWDFIPSKPYVDLDLRGVKFMYYWEDKKKFVLFKANKLKVKTTNFCNQQNPNLLKIYSFSNLEISGLSWATVDQKLSERLFGNSAQENTCTDVRYSIIVLLEEELWFYPPFDWVSLSLKVGPNYNREFIYTIDGNPYKSLQKLKLQLEDQSKETRNSYHLTYIPETGTTFLEFEETIGQFLCSNSKLVSLTLDMNHLRNNLVIEDLLDRISETKSLKTLNFISDYHGHIDRVLHFVEYKCYSCTKICLTFLKLKREGLKENLKQICDKRKIQIDLNESSIGRPIKLSNDINWLLIK